MTMLQNRYVPHSIMKMVKEKTLLEYRMLIGVHINNRDKEGRNALYWAIKQHGIHNAKLLVEHAISLEVAPGLHALFYAIEQDCYEITVLLVQSGVDPNIRDNKGRTPLMAAIEKEQFRTVCFLMRNGADLYAMDENYDMAADYTKRCNCNMIKDYVKHIELLNEQVAQEHVQTVCDLCKEISCKK